jgi:hypothetical protein
MTITKQIPGVAWGFFEYAGRKDNLRRALKRARTRAYIPDSAKLRLYEAEDRVEIPVNIMEKAEGTGVCPTYALRDKMPASVSSGEAVRAVKASELPYAIRIRDPNAFMRVDDDTLGLWVGRGRVNRAAAGLLNEILSGIGFRKNRDGGFRKTVIYKDRTGVEKYF